MGRNKALDTDEYEQRINPEIDARLTQFIKDNPKLHKRYDDMPKELLVRKQMYACMKRAEYKSGKNQDILATVESNPDLKARVEARISHVSPERRERAFIAAARDELVAQGMRQAQGQAQPPPLPAQTVAPAAPAVAGRGAKV